MSDQRGMWGNSRPEDNNIWWQNSGVATSEPSTHQQLLAAHQQQLVAAHQQQAAAAVAQHEAAVRSTAAAAQQLFSYKMASSFSNTNSNNSPQTTVSSSMSPQMRGYDYRNLHGSGNVRHEDAAAGITASQAAVAAGWWYNPSLQNNMGNMQNFQAQNSLQNSLLRHRGRPQRHIKSPSADIDLFENRQRNMPRGKSDAKPRGRMTAYAFFVQTCREEHKKKHPDENVVFAEFSKKCSERWKTMSDKEKKRFQEMAEKDKARYESEMQNYIPPKGEKGRGKKRKHLKDPNAPKRALSAFFWFCNDERGAVKKANPEYGVGDIAKELGRKWADCTPTTKQKYEAMADKDKARYERENTEYKKKSKPGYQAPATHHQQAVEDDDDEEEEEDDDE